MNEKGISYRTLITSVVIVGIAAIGIGGPVLAASCDELQAWEKGASNCWTGNTVAAPIGLHGWEAAEGSVTESLVALGANDIRVNTAQSDPDVMVSERPLAAHAGPGTFPDKVALLRVVSITFLAGVAGTLAVGYLSFRRRQA